MKSSRVMKIFEQYVKKFDMNNTNIKAKYFHSLKTMELSREIATSIGIFDEEEIVVCELVGLFHEIGSFDKNPEFHIINDSSEDYTNKTLEILFTDGLIRKITPDTKYDGIIKFAIYSLNKIGYPNNIDDKIIQFCDVLRDSHKLDLFRLVINYPYIDTRVDNYPTAMVYNEFGELVGTEFDEKIEQDFKGRKAFFMSIKVATEEHVAKVILRLIPDPAMWD